MYALTFVYRFLFAKSSALPFKQLVFSFCEPEGWHVDTTPALQEYPCSRKWGCLEWPNFASFLLSEQIKQQISRGWFHFLRHSEEKSPLLSSGWPFSDKFVSGGLSWWAWSQLRIGRGRVTPPLERQKSLRFLSQVARI